MLCINYIYSNVLTAPMYFNELQLKNIILPLCVNIALHKPILLVAFVGILLAASLELINLCILIFILHTVQSNLGLRTP